MLRLSRRFLPGSNVLDTKFHLWKCRTIALFTFFSNPYYIQGFPYRALIWSCKPGIYGGEWGMAKKRKVKMKLGTEHDKNIKQEEMVA